MHLQTSFRLKSILKIENVFSKHKVDNGQDKMLALQSHTFMKQEETR